MPRKRTKKPKRLRKEIDRYRELIREHEKKIKENLGGGKRLESIPAMEKEIEAFSARIKGIEERLKKRRKR